MLSILSAHIRQESEQWGDVLDEMRYMKTPVYSAKMLLMFDEKCPSIHAKNMQGAKHTVWSKMETYSKGS